MHTTEYPDGGGTVTTLENATEWAQLSTALKSLVPPTLQAAFNAGPDYFHAAAQHAEHPGLAKFCRACARSEQRLEIYDTRYFGSAAFLRVQPGELPLLLDLRPPPDRSLPKALREVYSVLGGIRFELNCSGSLITAQELSNLEQVWAGSSNEASDQDDDDDDDDDDASEFETDDQDDGDDEPFDEEQLLATLRQQHPELDDDAFQLVVQSVRASLANLATGGADEFPTLEQWSEGLQLGYPKLRELVPFYEDSGDYLCFNDQDEAIFVGWESGGVMRFGSVDDALNSVFEHLLSDGRLMVEFQPE